MEAPAETSEPSFPGPLPAAWRSWTGSFFPFYLLLSLPSWDSIMHKLLNKMEKKKRAPSKIED
jgi:hypothetical protein